MFILVGWYCEAIFHYFHYSMQCPLTFSSWYEVKSYNNTMNLIKCSHFLPCINFWNG